MKPNKISKIFHELLPSTTLSMAGEMLSNRRKLALLSSVPTATCNDACRVIDCKMALQFVEGFCSTRGSQFASALTLYCCRQSEHMRKLDPYFFEHHSNWRKVDKQEITFIMLCQNYPNHICFALRHNQYNTIVPLNTQFMAPALRSRPRSMLNRLGSTLSIFRDIYAPRLLANQISSEHQLCRLVVWHSYNMPCTSFPPSFDYLLDAGFPVECYNSRMCLLEIGCSVDGRKREIMMLRLFWDNA